MWIIRGIVIMVGAIALLWIGIKNAGTTIDFHFFTRTYVGTELYLIIAATFLAGMLVWAIGAWLREVQLSLRLAKARKETAILRNELADLRNLPLEEEAGSREID